MVIRKHCIELDDANKLNAKFQCTTQSYLQFVWGVNVFADFVPKTGLLNPPVLILLAVAV